jgi:NADPH:quinone reductase-like Zn-dependent oxidoreductase
MSRVVEFSEAGGPEVLRFKNVDVPEAGPGQLRIRVKAIGLNRAESMWREDKYIEPVKFPARLGYEAVGTVDSVGKDVTTIAIGDEVNTIPSFSMNQYGMYGEVVLAPIHAVVKHPKGLSPVEAASIWMMFVTAYGALIEDAKITSQDAVVIPSASSSVGLAAIQIALYGALSDQATTVPPLALIAKILTIKGHNIWATSGNPERQKAAVDFVINGLEKGKLKPIIDRVLPFDKIVDAHRYLEASEQVGKIVVTV